MCTSSLNIVNELLRDQTLIGDAVESSSCSRIDLILINPQRIRIRDSAATATEGSGDIGTGLQRRHTKRRHNCYRRCGEQLRGA